MAGPIDLSSPEDMDRQLANRERWQGWLDAIEAFDLAGKAPKSRNGPIDYVGVAVARAIADEAGNKGVYRAKPDDLACAVGLAKSAAMRAIQRLETAGFVEYERGARGRKATFRIVLPEQVRS